MLRHFATATIIATFALTAGGCLITGGSSMDQSGTKITSATLDRIELGTTSQAWLVATLGEPTEQTTVDDALHITVLRYEHIVTKAEGGTVFLLFAGGSEERNVTTTYFECVDGVVQRYWIER